MPQIAVDFFPGLHPAFSNMPLPKAVGAGGELLFELGEMYDRTCSQKGRDCVNLLQRYLKSGGSNGAQMEGLRSASIDISPVYVQGIGELHHLCGQFTITPTPQPQS